MNLQRGYLGIARIALQLTCAVTLASIISCSRTPPTASRGSIALRVDLRFPSAGCPSCPTPNGTEGTTYTIDSLQISAFEILDGGTALRATRGMSVDPYATEYQIELRAPYASRYRIAVQAIGTQYRAYTGPTLRGTQFHGEGEVDAILGGAEPLTIGMSNVVSLVYVGYDARQNPYIYWCRPPHAVGFTALGTRVGGTDTTISVADTLLDKQNLQGWTFRVRAELADGVSTAYSESEVSDYAIGSSCW